MGGIGSLLFGCTTVDQFSPNSVKHFASPQELIVQKNLNQPSGAAKEYVYYWGPQRKDQPAESMVPRKYMGSYCQSQNGRLTLAYKSSMSLVKNAWSKKLLNTYRDVKQGIGAYRCVRSQGGSWIVSIEPVTERKLEQRGEARVVSLLTKMMTEDEARRFYRAASTSKTTKATTTPAKASSSNKKVEEKEKSEEKKEVVSLPAKTAARVVETPQQQQMRLYVAARRDINSGRNQVNACNNAQRAYNYGKLQGAEGTRIYTESGMLVARCLTSVSSYRSRFPNAEVQAKRILQNLAKNYNHAGAKNMLNQMK
ncbi:MAG: hypothetical protein GX151_05325 [Gammaproteobacteria bacterium]|jgi:hypothetical protein|nr:hypothetical protein [Acinetobacter towneri]NLN57366.1 hypothetical protein [Gammaproteobacteria bacterium]